MTQKQTKYSNGPALSRRSVLKSAAALAVTAGTGFAPAVLSQSKRSIKFTLPWLAQGATAYVYIAQDQGYFADNGIEAEVSRGYGSHAAAESIANRNFDFGLVSAGATILQAARGLPLVATGTTNYDAFMGILVLADSTITKPKDLEGKQVGGVPASAEFPFWNAYVEKTGIDASKVNISQMDPRVMERSLAEGQIDAAITICSTSYSIIKALGKDTRAMLWSDVGLEFYANNIVTRTEVLESDPDLCAGVTDAVLRGLAFTLRNPEESLDIFLRMVPEMAVSKGGREFSRLSQGFVQASVVRDEALNNGLGYTDIDKFGNMVDLVTTYVAPSDAARPDPGELATNRFIGEHQLSAGEWDTVRSYASEFSRLLTG